MVLVAPTIEKLEAQLPSLPPSAPPRARALEARAISAREEGRYEEALADFATLGSFKDVENAYYLSKLAIHLAWSRQGKFSKALEVLTEASGLEDDRFALLCIGTTLHQLNRYNEALDTFEKVKESWPDDPDVWVYRMAPLLSLERGQAALESAEQAFPLRYEASDRGRLLYKGAALASLGLGLSALKHRWLPDYEKATKAFIKWRDRARRDKQAAAFKQAVAEFKQGLTEEDTPHFEEFMLGVRLASIRNPFKRWEALGKEISKDWPKDVSAVEAIREQRRW